MKIRKSLIQVVLCLLTINGVAQNIENKYFIGGSLSYQHDDLANNRLLSNYFPYTKNNTNSLEIFGEFGINKKINSAIGLDLGYYLSHSTLERTVSTPQVSISDYSKSTVSGFAFGPKYRIIRRMSEKIDLYTDFKLRINYLRHKNTVTQSDPLTYQSQLLDMNGNEFKYGALIVPGLVFYLDTRVGLKIEYTLIDLLYSTITESNKTDINFSPITSFDYGLRMKLSELKLGVIFKI
jgi:hypothetical protein